MLTYHRRWLLASLLVVHLSVHGTIITDSGCACSTARNSISTPGISINLTLGCGNWYDRPAKFCAVDRNNTNCGTFDAEVNGYIDSCTQASLSNFRYLPPEQLLEWDQTNTTFYTGQNITLLWNSNKMDDYELTNIIYVGNTGSIRTLVSNANTTLGIARVRITDLSINIAGYPVYLTAVPGISSQLALNSTSPLTLIQSKIINLDATRTSIYGNQTSVINTVVVAGTEVNVTWRGLGVAALPFPNGVVIRLSKLGPGSTTIYTNGGANNTVNFTIPLSFTGSTYTFSITMFAYGGSTYSASTGQFVIVAPPSSSTTPTPTPSATSSPSSTSTTSASPTTTVTATPTPTTTNTGTVTATPTISVTSSTTETARASIDVIAIARVAQSLNDDSNLAVTIGAILGTAVTMVGVFLGYHLYQRRKLTQARLRKLKDTTRWVADTRESYLGKGVDVEGGNFAAPQMVVYQVNVTNTPTNSLTSRSGSTPAPTAGQYRQPTVTGRGSNRRPVL